MHLVANSKERIAAGLSLGSAAAVGATVGSLRVELIAGSRGDIACPCVFFCAFRLRWIRRCCAKRSALVFGCGGLTTGSESFFGRLVVFILFRTELASVAPVRSGICREALSAIPFSGRRRLEVHEVADGEYPTAIVAPAWLWLQRSAASYCVHNNIHPNNRKESKRLSLTLFASLLPESLLACLCHR